MPCKTVLASSVASGFLEMIKTQTAALSSTPLLIGFLANEDEFAKKYALWTEKTCESLGMKILWLITGVNFQLRLCSRTELEEKLDEANADEKGII